MAGELHDPALVVGWLNIEFAADIVERNNGKIIAITQQPGVFSAARQSAHHRHLAGKIFVCDVMQIGLAF